MKKLNLLLLLVVLFFGCKKSDKDTSIPQCYEDMKERYKDELKCTKKSEMEVNLYEGIYKNERVYFIDIICPSCMIVPPSYGYSCKGDRIEFTDFAQVSDARQIYNSCIMKFAE